MTTITIPKVSSAEQNLIAVPRDTYEEFLRWLRDIKSQKTFKPSISEKKALAKARKNFQQGNYLTIEELKRDLDATHR